MKDVLERHKTRAIIKTDYKYRSYIKYINLEFKFESYKFKVLICVWQLIYMIEIYALTKY